MSLRIRRYRATDNERVRELHFGGLDQMGANTPGPWDADLDDIESVYLERGDFLVGEVEGQVVAMGALRPLEGRTAELKRLRVAASHQGSGYGETMARTLVARAHELGFDRIVLDTTSRQLPAQRLFAKLGFREVARKPQGESELISYEYGAGEGIR
jgi:N-acetylglutamate synthase-like GNAT family acetyltransferase